MKKIITTTSSLLTIFAISATAQSLSFTDGKTYDNLSSTYKDATLSAFEVKGGSKVVGADFSGATINGIITISNEDPNTGSKYNTLKVLGNGKLTKKLTVVANKFTKSAEKAIVDAGGTIEVI